MTTDLNGLATSAAVLLRQHFNTDLSLTTPVLLKDTARSLVLRCQVILPPPAIAPIDSVIVKYIRNDVRGFSDWASLAFLAKIPAAHGLAPRFLAGDSATRLFVLEDLGGSQTLDALLRTSDAQTARAALRSLSICMARLHSATFTGQDSFAEIRNSLPAAAGLSCQQEAKHWLAGQDQLIGWLHAANCTIPHGFTACLQQIAQVYAEPGPFLCFTHGDPAPTNNHIAAGRVRLLDFEYGGFRHALYDITAWNVLCPLPAAHIQEMRECFRQELARACPILQDEAQYAHAWAMLCAYRALAILTWISPEVIQENHPWVDQQWTSRHAVLAAMARLSEATRTVAQLAPVHEFAHILSVALHQQWPEFQQASEIIPLWPAFQQ